ncbi:MAG TPA: hypothetical protein VGN16_21110 [Acidobacteriaceae bacterium]|jgi:hypothetical protein
MMNWLVGKKTYLIAAAVCLATGGLVFAGRLTPETACAVGLFALGLFAASFRSALQTHQEDTMQLLRDLAGMGMSVSTRNVPQAIAAGARVVKDAAVLATECGAGESA